MEKDQILCPQRARNKRKTHYNILYVMVSGNNWGFCEDGTGTLGCGPQETFRTCSDISLF
jgi:hypothetical protein